MPPAGSVTNILMGYKTWHMNGMRRQQPREIQVMLRTAGGVLTKNMDSVLLACSFRCKGTDGHQMSYGSSLNAVPGHKWNPHGKAESQSPKGTRNQ